MRESLSRSPSKIWATVAVVCVLLSGLIAYHLQLVDSAAYLGLRYLNLSAARVMYLLLTAAGAILLLPATSRTPVDFFIMVYLIFIVLPHIMFLTAGNVLSLHTTLSALLIVASPLAMAALAYFAPVRLDLPRLLPWGISVCALACFASVVSAYLLVFGPPSSGWSLDSTYIRRLEARGILPERSIQAYALSMTVNSIAPYLAFVGTYWRRPSLILISAATALASYYSIGLKAPSAYVLLSVILGFLWTRQKHVAVYVVVALTVSVSTALGLLEYLLLSFSELFEYIHRRVFVVPPLVTSAYFSMFEALSVSHWDWTFGMKASEKLSFEIGYLHFGNVETNANTNAPTTAFLAEGISGLAFALLLVGGYVFGLQVVHRVRRRASCCFLALQVALLFGEQAARTVLISSGFLLLMVVELGSWGACVPSARSFLVGRRFVSRKTAASAFDHVFPSRNRGRSL